MSVVRLVRTILLVVASAVGIAACAPTPSRSVDPATPAASPSPLVDVPLDSRGPVPSGCYEVVATPSQDPPSIERMTHIASVILVGTFEGHDPARWNTPDGHRPTPQELRDTGARLHRPLRITLEQVPRGSADDATHAFDPGGRLDCDLTAIAGGRELTLGGRYVFFFLGVTNSVGATLEDLQLADAWPVGADDVVETPGEGPIALVDLVAAIEQVTPSP